MCRNVRRHLSFASHHPLPWDVSWNSRFGLSWSAKPHRRFSTKRSSGKESSSRPSFFLTFLLGASAAASVYTRRWRSLRLDEMDPITTLPPGLEDTLLLMERTGLMGRSGKKSVKEELQDISRWHTEHNFKGGLVVRELTQPLFGKTSGGTVQGIEDLMQDPMHLARRECYYLYYEITPIGEVKQQIFCRGTTLLVDILTCLSFWMTFDTELGCRVHLGFRNQADRIIEDILPLLSPISDERATIEVSGHSLGAAVAYILAAKLRKKGYRVVRATAIASPRFCASQDASNQIYSLLPMKNLRIENEHDFVTFLPQFGYHTGNKLYLSESSSQKRAFYIPFNEKISSWSDSVFINCRVWELLAAMGKPHRIPNYISYLQAALDSAH